MKIRKVFKGLYLILVFYLLLIPVTISAEKIDVESWSKQKFLGIDVDGVSTDTQTLTNSYKLDANSTNVVDTDTVSKLSKVIEQALKKEDNILGIYNACKGTGLGSFETDGLSVYAYVGNSKENPKEYHWTNENIKVENGIGWLKESGYRNGAKGKEPEYSKDTITNAIKSAGFVIDNKKVYLVVARAYFPDKKDPDKDIHGIQIYCLPLKAGTYKTVDEYVVIFANSFDIILKNDGGKLVNVGIKEDKLENLISSCKVSENSDYAIVSAEGNDGNFLKQRLIAKGLGNTMTLQANKNDLIPKYVSGDKDRIEYAEHYTSKIENVQYKEGYGIGEYYAYVSMSKASSYITIDWNDFVENVKGQITKDGDGLKLEDKGPDCLRELFNKHRDIKGELGEYKAESGYDKDTKYEYKKGSTSFELNNGKKDITCIFGAYYKGNKIVRINFKFLDILVIKGVKSVDGYTKDGVLTGITVIYELSNGKTTKETYPLATVYSEKNGVWYRHYESWRQPWVGEGIQSTTYFDKLHNDTSSTNANHASFSFVLGDTYDYKWSEKLDKMKFSVVGYSIMSIPRFEVSDNSNGKIIKYFYEMASKYKDNEDAIIKLLETDGINKFYSLQLDLSGNKDLTPKNLTSEFKSKNGSKINSKLYAIPIDSSVVKKLEGIDFGTDGCATGLDKSDIFTMLESYYGAKSYSKVFTPDNRKLSYIASDVLWSKFYGRSAYSSDVSDHAQVFVLGDKQLNGYNTYAPAFSPVSSNGEYSGAVPIGVLLSKGNGSYSKASEVDKVDITNGNISDMRYYEGIPTSQLLTTTLNTKTRYIKSKISKDTEFSAKAVPLLDYSDKLDKNDFLNIKISDCHKEWKSGYVSEYTGETYETIRDIIENADICALIEVLSGQPGFNENTKAVDYNYKSKGEQRNTFSFYADYILGMDKTKTNNFRKKAVEFLTSFGGENSSKDLGLLNESGLINGKNNYDIEAVQTNYEDYLYSSVKKVENLNKNYRTLVADLLPKTTDGKINMKADISGKSYEAVRQMYYLLQVFSLNSSIASLQFDEELKFEEKGNKPLGYDGNVWDDGLKDAGRAVDIYYQFVTQLKSSTSVDRKSISCYQIEPVIGIKSPYESDRLVICNLQELQVFTHNKITGKVDVNPNGKSNWTTSVLTVAKVSEAFDLPISNKQAYKKILGNGLDGTVKMNPSNENVYKLQKYLYDGTYGKVEDSKENLTVGSWTIKQSKLSSQVWKAISGKKEEDNRWINTIGYNTIKEYLDKLVKLAEAYNNNKEYSNISYLWVNSPFFLQTVDNKIEDYIPFINVYKTWGQGVGGEGNKEFTNSFENAYITALPMWADSPSARKKIIDNVTYNDKTFDPMLSGSYNDSINYLNDYYRALKDIAGSYDVLNKFLLGNYSYNRFVTVLRGSLDGIAYNTDSSNLTSSTYGDGIDSTAKKQNKYYWLRAPLLGSKSFYLQADIDKTRFYQAVSTPWTVLMSNILGQIKIDPASGNNEINDIRELKDNMAKVNAYGYYQELMQGTESLSDETLSSLGISNAPQKGNYVARMNALAIREYSPDENTEKIQKADEGKGKTDNPFSVWTFENNKKSLCELMYTPADRSVAGTLAAYVNSLDSSQENTKEYFTDLADRWYGNTVFYKEEYSGGEGGYDKHASTGTIQGYLLIGAGVTAPSNPKLSLKTTISPNYNESTVEVGESTLTKGLPENSSTTGKGWTWEEGYNVGTDINKSPTLIAGFRYTGTEDELADFFGQSATGEDYNAAEDNNSEYDVYVSITRKIDDEDINKLVSKNWATSTNIRLFPITSSEYADGTRKLPWTAMQASISQFSTAKLEEQLKVLKNKFGTSPAYSTIKGFTCNGINIEDNKSIGSVQFSDSSKKFLYSFTKVIDKNEDRTEDDTSGRWITFRGDDVKELYKWLLGKTTSNKYSVLKYIDTFTSLNTIQKKKSVLGDSFTINYELNWKIRKREVVLKDNKVVETNIVSVQSAEPTKCKVRYKFTQGTAPMYVNVKATPNYKLGWGTNPLKSTVKLGTLNKTEGSGNCEDVSIRVDVSDNDTSTRLTKLIKSLKKDHNVTKNSKLKFKVKYKLTKKGIEATNAKPEDKDTLVKTPEAVAEASTIKDKLIKSFSTETEFTYKEFCILHRLFDYKDKSIKWSRVRFTDKISELPVKLNKYIGTLVNSYQAVQTSLIITYDGTQIYKNKEPYEAEDTEQVEIFESGVPYQDLVIKNNEVKVDDKLQKANKLTSQDATTTIEDEYNPVLFAEISHKNSSNTQLSNDIENLPDSQRIQLKITIKRPSIEQENVEIIENKAAKINYLETIEEQGLDKFDEDDSYTQVKNGVIIKTSIGAFKKLVLGNGKPVFTFTDSSVSDLRYSKSTEVDGDEACKITLNYRMEVTYSLDNGKTFKTFIPDDGEAKVEYTLSNENEPYKVYEKTVDIPKAWAELKNTKGYADTQNYEAMNGVTTDQLLYFTAGGSEYLYHIDIYADQNYWAKRNYKITWEKFQTDDALEEQDAPATGVKNKSGSAGKTHLNELLQKNVEEKTSEVFHGSTLDEAQKTEQQAKENLCEKLDMHNKMEEFTEAWKKLYGLPQTGETETIECFCGKKTMTLHVYKQMPGNYGEPRQKELRPTKFFQKEYKEVTYGKPKVTICEDDCLCKCTGSLNSGYVTGYGYTSHSHTSSCYCSPESTNEATGVTSKSSLGTLQCSSGSCSHSYVEKWFVESVWGKVSMGIPQHTGCTNGSTSFDDIKEVRKDTSKTDIKGTDELWCSTFITPEVYATKEAGNLTDFVAKYYGLDLYFIKEATIERILKVDGNQLEMELLSVPESDGSKPMTLEQFVAKQQVGRINKDPKDYLSVFSFFADDVVPNHTWTAKEPPSSDEDYISAKTGRILYQVSTEQFDEVTWDLDKAELFDIVQKQVADKSSDYLEHQKEYADSEGNFTVSQARAWWNNRKANHGNGNGTSTIPTLENPLVTQMDFELYKDDGDYEARWVGKVDNELGTFYSKFTGMLWNFLNMNNTISITSDILVLQTSQGEKALLNKYLSTSDRVTAPDNEEGTEDSSGDVDGIDGSLIVYTVQKDENKKIGIDMENPINLNSLFNTSGNMDNTFVFGNPDTAYFIGIEDIPVVGYTGYQEKDKKFQKANEEEILVTTMFDKTAFEWANKSPFNKYRPTRGKGYVLSFDLYDIPFCGKWLYDDWIYDATTGLDGEIGSGESRINASRLQDYDKSLITGANGTKSILPVNGLYSIVADADYTLVYNYKRSDGTYKSEKLEYEKHGNQPTEIFTTSKVSKNIFATEKEIMKWINYRTQYTNEADTEISVNPIIIQDPTSSQEFIITQLQKNNNNEEITTQWLEGIDFSTYTDGSDLKYTKKTIKENQTQELITNTNFTSTNGVVIDNWAIQSPRGSMDTLFHFTPISGIATLTYNSTVIANDYVDGYVYQRAGVLNDKDVTYKFKVSSGELKSAEAKIELYGIKGDNSGVLLSTERLGSNSSQTISTTIGAGNSNYEYIEARIVLRVTKSIGFGDGPMLQLKTASFTTDLKSTKEETNWIPQVKYDVNYEETVSILGDYTSSREETFTENTQIIIGSEGYPAGTYKITATGEGHERNGGKGATITGDFDLKAGDVLKIYTKNNGTAGINIQNNSSSGCLAAYVTLNDKVILVGGGGGGFSQSRYLGKSLMSIFEKVVTGVQVSWEDGGLLNISASDSNAGYPYGQNGADFSVREITERMVSGYKTVKLSIDDNLAYSVSKSKLLNILSDDSTNSSIKEEAKAQYLLLELFYNKDMVKAEWENNYKLTENTYINDIRMKAKSYLDSIGDLSGTISIKDIHSTTEELYKEYFSYITLSNYLDSIATGTAQLNLLRSENKNINAINTKDFNSLKIQITEKIKLINNKEAELKLLNDKRFSEEFDEFDKITELENEIKILKDEYDELYLDICNKLADIIICNYREEIYSYTEKFLELFNEYIYKDKIIVPDTIRYYEVTSKEVSNLIDIIAGGTTKTNKPEDLITANSSSRCYQAGAGGGGYYTALPGNTMKVVYTYNKAENSVKMEASIVDPDTHRYGNITYNDDKTQATLYVSSSGAGGSSWIDKEKGVLTSYEAVGTNSGKGKVSVKVPEQASNVITNHNYSINASTINNAPEEWYNIEQVTTNIAASATGLAGDEYKSSQVLYLDREFTIYFPNVGNFNSGAEGNTEISKIYSEGQDDIINTWTSGNKGYTDKMDTTKWTWKKIVKFGFDVIYNGRFYNENTYIEIPVVNCKENHKHTDDCYKYNFYVPLSADETTAVSSEENGLGWGIGYTITKNSRPATMLNSLYKGGYLYTGANIENITGLTHTMSYTGKDAKKETITGNPWYEDNFSITYSITDKSATKDLTIDNYTGDYTVQPNFLTGFTTMDSTTSLMINNNVNNNNDKYQYSKYIEKLFRVMIPYTTDDEISINNRLHYSNEASPFYTSNYAADHISRKYVPINISGRIGNLIMEDTGDWRFANLFKKIANPLKWIVEDVVAEVNSEGVLNYDAQGKVQNEELGALNIFGDLYDIRFEKLVENMTPLQFLYDSSGQLLATTYNALKTTTLKIPNSSISNAVNITNLDTYSTKNSQHLIPIEFPLSGDKNTNRKNSEGNANKDISKALTYNYPKIGYNILMDISTIGNYDEVTIIPRYYIIDANNANAAPIPVDLYYVDAKSKNYKLLNKFDFTSWEWEDKNNNDIINTGELKAGVINTDDTTYHATINWLKEWRRRNVAAQEMYQTLYYHGNMNIDALNKLSVNYFNSKNDLQYPSGSDYIYGTAQLMKLKNKNKTYIGSISTYNELIQQDYDWNMVENQITHAQRWHFNLKLPTSTVIVDKGTVPGRKNVDKETTSIDKYKGNGYYLITTLDIRANSTTGDWTLVYTGDPANSQEVVVPTESPDPSDGDGGFKKINIPKDEVPERIVVVYDTEETAESDVTLYGTH